MGDTFDLPKSATVSHNEMPYWMLQAMPDRINYTIVGHDASVQMLKGILNGEVGFHSRVQDYLEVLGMKLDAIDAMGSLMQAWTRYIARFDESKDPQNDPTVTKSLEDFQRLACVKSSYKKLPLKAAKATFWFDASKVTLPRITKQEHIAMG